MGLDTSHNCWHGSYSSFNEWRGKVCEVAGYGNLRDRQGFGGDTPWPDDDALIILLSHSDCDGEIEFKDCLQVAKRLDELLPALKRADSYYADLAQTFIDGLKLAGIKKENVEFQ